MSRWVNFFLAVGALISLAFSGYFVHSRRDLTGKAESFLESNAGSESAVWVKNVEAKPVEEKSVEEAKVEEKGVEEKPVEEAKVEEKPVEEKQVGEAKVGEKPVEEKQVGEAKVEEKAVEEKPVEEAKVEEKALEEKKAASIWSWSMLENRSEPIGHSPPEGTMEEERKKAIQAGPKNEQNVNSIDKTSKDSSSVSSSSRSNASGDPEDLFPLTIAEEWSRLHILKFLVPAVVACVVIFEMFHKAYAGVDLDTPVRLPEDLRRPHVGSFLSGSIGWWSEYIMEPFDRGKRNCLMLVLFAFQLAKMWVSYQRTMIHGRWFDMLAHPAQSKDLAAPLTLNYCMLLVLVVLETAYSDYISQWFQIDWKTWMTVRFQSMWMRNKAYYCIELQNDKKVDNPDQRIQEDCQEFCKYSFQLINDFIHMVLGLIVYLPILWNVSPSNVLGFFELKGWLVYFTLIWAIVGTMSTHLLGRALIPINYAMQVTEADYRYALVRVRENSESVAMLHAEDAENANLNSHWEHIRRVTWENMIFTKVFEGAMSLYTSAEMAILMAVLAPSYLRGDLTAANLKIAENSMGHVRMCFEFIISSYATIVILRSTCARLQELQEQMQKHEDVKFLRQAAADHALGSPTPQTDSEVIMLRGLQVLLPDKSLLVEVPGELEIRPGDHVLLSGPVGSGKSTLLRALADMWPHVQIVQGGLYRAPPPEHCLFVPRIPVFPKGSLRRAVSYPEAAGTYSDTRIVQVLRDVGLQCLLERDIPNPNEDGDSEDQEAKLDIDLAGKTAEEQANIRALNQKSTWNTCLSAGQQQQLMLAHVLLRKPRNLWLDESTSHMDIQGASDLYTLLFDQLGPESSIVTVTHDLQGMMPLHSKHIVLNPVSKTLEAAPMVLTEGASRFTLNNSEASM